MRPVCRWRPTARPRKELRPAPPEAAEEAAFVPLRAQLVVRQRWRDRAGFTEFPVSSPALNVRCFALCRRESGSQESQKCTVKVGGRIYSATENASC